MPKRVVAPKTPEGRRFTPYAVSGSRAANTAANPEFVRQMLSAARFDASHRCRDILRGYQRACHKDDPERADASFRGAKAALAKVFGSVDAAFAAVRGVERELQRPADGVVRRRPFDPLTALALSQLDTFAALVDRRVQTLCRFRGGSAKARELGELCERFAADWEGCYHGRRAYRLECERERDPGHDAAYKIFKIAVAISRVLQKRGLPDACRTAGG